MTLAKIFLSAAFAVAVAAPAAADYIDVFQHNLVARCASLAERDAARCFDEIIESIKQAQQNISEFQTVFNQIRGPSGGEARTYDGCTAATVNGRRPGRTPAPVAAGKPCAADWNDYRNAIGALMHESCEIKASFRDSTKLKQLRLAAEAAENNYDACFAHQLSSVHQQFAFEWNITSGDGFFAAHGEAVREYKAFDLDNQLQALFAACKAAVAAYARRNANGADMLVRDGVCQ